ncbi:hypothetical protein BKK81_23955 [Cupriavidus sp. USMAHM13]|uniref:Uncharacterized protein n=1 Tax=Cupriavidus malaysiensis TaxID=367825 RepID=A0ABN4TYX1_9BURK|nr:MULTISPECIES: hypothetical protein [Cupriavidus]AOZ02326.1 hypothetical protein BKK81_23955 [Cupriavidus sp. USMAHM13]AOZ10296.1 hypothetical protein BKK80_32345 [Cupriavidus malaysiensis]
MPIATFVLPLYCREQRVAWLHVSPILSEQDAIRDVGVDRQPRRDGTTAGQRDAALPRAASASLLIPVQEYFRFPLLFLQR